MDARWRHPYGLRLTLRHLMILVVYAALVAAPSRNAPREYLSFILPLSPPLLALLVMVFERPGPAKYWLVGLLASLTLPALVAWCDLAGLWIWTSGLARPHLGLVLPAALVLHAAGLLSIIRFARRLPGPCPDCGLRSYLPLGRRDRGMRWCASCGHLESPATRPARSSQATRRGGPI